MLWVLTYWPGPEHGFLCVFSVVEQNQTGCDDADHQGNDRCDVDGVEISSRVPVRVDDPRPRRSSLSTLKLIKKLQFKFDKISSLNDYFS